jgi:hypothetical protein
MNDARKTSILGRILLLLAPLPIQSLESNEGCVGLGQDEAPRSSYWACGVGAARSPRGGTGLLLLWGLRSGTPSALLDPLIGC